MRPFTSSLTILLVTTLLGACSFRDYTYLQESDDGAVTGGKSSRGGAAGAASGGRAGGGSSAGGTAGRTGGENQGGTNQGGVGGSGNSTSGAGMAGAGGPSLLFNQLGPWEFDTAADTAANWQISLKGNVLGWVADGEQVPLGAMTLSCGGKAAGEVNHEFTPRDSSVPTETMDLSGYLYTAYAKAQNTTVNVQLFVTDSTYYRGNAQPVAVDATTWTKIEFPVSSPATYNPGYNPAKIMRLGLSLQGCGDVALIDRIALVRNGSGGNSGAAGAAGAGGTSGAGAGGYAGTAGRITAGTAGRASTASAGTAGRAGSGGSSGATSSAGTAGR